jgi:hypothetical protein
MHRIQPVRPPQAAPLCAVLLDAGAGRRQRQRLQERAGHLRRLPRREPDGDRCEHAGQPRRRGVHRSVRAVLGDVGQLADKFEKSRLIRYIKVSRSRSWQWALRVLVADLTLLFVALALMGVHSTLFGPVKYAILPQQLKTEELVGGNGLVEMGTFVAILIGTIAGGLLVAVVPYGPEWRALPRSSSRSPAGWSAGPFR